MKMRWLRTCLREVNYRMSPDTTGTSYEEIFEGTPTMFLRGLRSDGQMFVSFAPVECEDATPEKLREHLDTMLNDPALNGVVNAEEMRLNLTHDRYKGHYDWVEEPEEQVSSPRVYDPDYESIDSEVLESVIKIEKERNEHI